MVVFFEFNSIFFPAFVKIERLTVFRMRVCFGFLWSVMLFFFLGLACLHKFL
jgi:hypothetical protein